MGSGHWLGWGTALSLRPLRAWCYTPRAAHKDCTPLLPGAISPHPHAVELEFPSPQLLYLIFKEMVESLNVNMKELEHGGNLPGPHTVALGPLPLGRTCWDLLPS